MVARDFGFAPNPFFGVCTLATCKPLIRRVANVGDWVLGTGSRKYGLEGHLVFAMKVAEAVSFDEYWRDSRFQCKKPNLRGSRKQAFGDNIYRKDRSTGVWLQSNSHHSYPDGSANPLNVQHDTQTDRVLIATEFIYFGGNAVSIPTHLSGVCARRGHKSNFKHEFVSSFLTWIVSLRQKGFQGPPAEF